MASKSKKARNFQIDFLKFLNEKKIAEVHIYHHIMNYWSNDLSMISLQEIKDAITELCDKKLIISKDNAHTSIGAQGVPEEYQKDNAICIIQDTGLKYLKLAELKKTIINIIIVLIIVTALYFVWHYRNMIAYFFR